MVQPPSPRIRWHSVNRSARAPRTAGHLPGPPARPVAAASAGRDHDSGQRRPHGLTSQALRPPAIRWRYRVAGMSDQEQPRPHRAPRPDRSGSQPPDHARSSPRVSCRGRAGTVPHDPSVHSEPGTPDPVPSSRLSTDLGPPSAPGAGWPNDLDPFIRLDIRIPNKTPGRTFNARKSSPEPQGTHACVHTKPELIVFTQLPVGPIIPRIGYRADRRPACGVLTQYVQVAPDGALNDERQTRTRQR